MSGGVCLMWSGRGFLMSGLSDLGFERGGGMVCCFESAVSLRLKDGMDAISMMLLHFASWTDRLLSSPGFIR